MSDLCFIISMFVNIVNNVIYTSPSPCSIERYNIYESCRIGLKANTLLLQALEVIHELQKQFPIKRSPMRLRLTVPEQEVSALLEKLTTWNASIVSKDPSGNQLSIVSPSLSFLCGKSFPKLLRKLRFF